MITSLRRSCFDWMLAKKERSATSTDYRYLLYLLILLSGHADWQGVDISFTVFVCGVYVFVCLYGYGFCR